MGKFHAIASSLLMFGTINITFMPTANLITQKGYIPGLPKIATLSSNENDFVYSDYLLRYFIYKSSNISDNDTVKMMEENIVNNKNNIYGIGNDTSKVTMANKNLFEMSLIASIVNISIYGMKNGKEFFAEAYSKWMTTPDAMKNKSGEILNEFFIEIYSPLQKNNFGPSINDLKGKLNLIDQYVAKSKIIYDTTLRRQQYDTVDLKYASPFFGTSFGLQQAIPSDVVLGGHNYTFNAFKIALIMGQSNDNEDVENSMIKFNGNVLRNNIINPGSDNLSWGLANMMNDSYTKASAGSLKKYHDFINAAKQTNYASFYKLNSDLKTLTKYENYAHQLGSTFFLEDSVKAMQEYYQGDDNVIRILKDQILTLFNTTYAIVDNNFKYFLIGFLFSPDAPLLGQAGRTAAYTAHHLLEPTTSKTNQYVSTRDAYIVISAKGFNDALWRGNNSQYQMGGGSSPNIFCTLNHEMGHAVDAYYGMFDDARYQAKTYFKDILNNLGIKGQYAGNIFGYDDIVSYNKKVIFVKIILIVMFGIFCISIITAIIWGTSRKIATQKK